MTDFKKIILPTLLLIVLALTIGLTPRFPIGTIRGLERVIDIRGEDIWILILFFFWMAAILKSRQGKMEKPPLLLPILFWLGAGFLSLLINLLLGNLNIVRGAFYFAKELQLFFVYFFTFFHLRNLLALNTLIRAWLLVGLANIAWVLMQLFVIGRRGEYGTSALNEWGVFPTGAFFLLLFIFLFNWWLYSFWRKGISLKKEYLHLVAILTIIAGILGALSKTVLVGLFFALAVSMLFYILKEKTLKAVIASFWLFILVISFTFFVYFALILPNLAGAERLMEILSPSDLLPDTQRTRFAVSALQLQEAIRHTLIQETIQRPLIYVFGYGKGAILLGPESHNHYLRNFIETGIVGSIAFLVLMAAILNIAWKGFKRNEDLTAGLGAGLIVTTLTMLFMSIVVDAFIVVKANMTYWFFAGLTMAALYHGAKEKSRN